MYSVAEEKNHQGSNIKDSWWNCDFMNINQLLRKHNTWPVLCFVYNTAAIFNSKYDDSTLSSNIHLCMGGDLT